MAYINLQLFKFYYNILQDLLQGEQENQEKVEKQKQELNKYTEVFSY